MAIVKNLAGNSVTVDKSFDSNRFAITPSDTLALAVPIQAIFVGVAGNVTMKRAGEVPVVVPFQAGGPYLVGGVTHIMSTGTTATGLIGLADGGLN